MADTMWPLTLDMTHDECRGFLRQSELETYSSVVGTFRAQGALDETKARILRELRKILHISDERHKAEARRVANDERLCTVAEMLAGPNTGQDWSREGHRSYPLLHRGVAHTALLTVANEAQVAAQRANYLLPLPEHSQRDATLDQQLPIDPRTPVVIGDQHAPPKPPPAPPANQKPLLKRTLTGDELHRKRISDLVAPLQHTNMRIQELYHQHANTPQPHQPATADLGPLSAQLGALISNSCTLSHISPAMMPVASTVPPSATPQSNRKTGGAASATKRAPKTTKAARAPKTPRTPAAISAAASRAAATGNQRAPKSSTKQQQQHPQAALQADVAYGSSLKSRKLNYAADKNHASLLGETFPVDQTNSATGAAQPSNTTFLWPPASHDASSGQHFTVTDSILQTYAPLTLSTATAAASSPLPSQQALLTQNSPVQVVFTSSTVEMLPLGDPQRPLPNNFITESTPITWVTDDVLPVAGLQPPPPTSVAVTLPHVAQQQQHQQPTPQLPPPIIVPLQSPVMTQQPQQQSQPQQLPPPQSPVLLQSLQPAPFVQPPILQPLLVAAAASNAAVVAPAMPNTAGRPMKMVVHTPRKAAPHNNAAAAPKVTKTSRKKAAQVDAGVVIAGRTNPAMTSPVPHANAMKPPPTNSVPPLHPPLPTNLQQLLDTSLQIHSITSKQHPATAAPPPAAATASSVSTVPTHPKIVHTTVAAKPTVAPHLHSKPMNIVHKINVHPQHQIIVGQGTSSTATTPSTTTTAPTATAAPPAPSTSSGHSKPKVQITHQEIIVPPPKSGMGANIVSQLKTMQSKGNVKLVQSANGSIMLKGTNSEVVIPVASSAGARIASGSSLTVSASTTATMTAVKPPTNYPKIQLVKARNNISNIVMMQKLPPGKFTASGSATSGRTVAVTALTTATSTAMTPAKDQQQQQAKVQRTVKLVPFNQSTSKMVIMSGTGTQMPLKALSMPTVTVTMAAAAPVKITEDTPVDILTAESDVIDVQPPPPVASAPIVLETMGIVRTPNVGVDASTIAKQTTPKHKLVVNTSASAVRAQPSGSGSPTKRLRIDEKKMVKVTTSAAASGTTVVTAVAPVALPVSSGSVQQTVQATPVMAPPPQTMLLADSTDWEKELDEQTRRNVPVPNNARGAAAPPIDELIEEDDGDDANSDEAIIVGEYMATEDDIIQYEGDDYQELNSDARSAKTETAVVGAPTTASSTGGTNGSAVTIVSTAATVATAATTAATTTTTLTAASDAGDREEGEASETIVMQMEEVDEHGQSHMRNVSLEELVDSGHILMDDS